MTLAYNIIKHVFCLAPAASLCGCSVSIQTEGTQQLDGQEGLNRCSFSDNNSHSFGYLLTVPPAAQFFN